MAMAALGHRGLTSEVARAPSQPSSEVSAFLVGKGCEWAAFVQRIGGQWWRVNSASLAFIPRMTAAARQAAGPRGVIVWVVAPRELATQNELLMIMESANVEPAVTSAEVPELVEPELAEGRLSDSQAVGGCIDFAGNAAVERFGDPLSEEAPPAKKGKAVEEWLPEQVGSATLLRRGEEYRCPVQDCGYVRTASLSVLRHYVRHRDGVKLETALQISEQ